MLTIKQARYLAQKNNRLARQDSRAHALVIKQICALPEADREMVLKYIGLEEKLSRRRYRKAEAEAGNLDSNRGDHASYWHFNRRDDEGDRCAHRYWTTSPETAREIAERFAPSENHSAYSPTGLWFNVACHGPRQIKPNVWQVVAIRALDC
jgi:hypothetical protein